MAIKKRIAPMQYDLQPIDDNNRDCPNFGGSPITLPPDLEVGIRSVSLQIPTAWHRFAWLKEKLWPIATGKGIKVAVLDTGYSKHKYGPEPIAARSFINGQSWADRNGHGTHCAGTVLCRRDSDGNSIGWAPDADLIVGKVLSNEGSGGSDGIAAGIRWAAEQGAHVISMSLGGGGPDTGTNQAIDYAWSLGCMVIAAAGNSGYNGSNSIGWPAKYSNCLCTAAYRKDGAIANFSSGGREVDWAFPGQNIISFSTDGSSFQDMSGTSMATPGSAGLAACWVERRLANGQAMFASAQEVRDHLSKALVDAGAPGDDVRFGKGIVDGNFLMSAILADLTGSGA